MQSCGINTLFIENLVVKTQFETLRMYLRGGVVIDMLRIRVMDLGILKLDDIVLHQCMKMQHWL